MLMRARARARTELVIKVTTPTSDGTVVVASWMIF